MRLLMCGYALPIKDLGRHQDCMQQRLDLLIAPHTVSKHDAFLLVQGMSISRLPDGAVAYEGSMQSRRKRLGISVSIAALRSLWWLGSTAICLWRNIVSVCSGTDSYARHPA